MTSEKTSLECAEPIEDLARFADNGQRSDVMSPTQRASLRCPAAEMHRPGLGSLRRLGRLKRQR